MSVDLRGIFSPITTPFDENGELYKSQVKHNIEKWNSTKLAGYVVCGSTGEAVLLTTQEKLQLWEWAAEYAAPDKLLVAGTGAESMRETVWLTNQAAARGYKAAMVRTPGYYKSHLNRGEGQIVFYRAVAAESKIPIMIYNWPEVTGVDIPAEAVAELSRHPNIVAIKESSGNIEKVMQMVREVEPGFQVLAGSELSLWPSLAVGATGAIVTYANAAPFSLLAIWEAHCAGDNDTARRQQNRIARSAHVVAVKHGIPGLKYAMELNGYYGGPCRLPLLPLTPEARAEIRETFEDVRP
jgi:4-hydroxy-2-oxoglutarate aldolase